MAAKPIVAATDGSPASIGAVEWAAREAVVRGAPLRIVSVPGGRSANGAAPDTAAGTLHEGSAQALAGAAHQAALVSPRLAPDTCLLSGQPVDALVQAAEDAGLLAVGTRGSVLHAIVGSVSRYVAARAACPVVIVREGTAAEHHVVGVGVHYPELAAAAFRFAFQEAALHQAAVLALHGYSLADPRPPRETRPGAGEPGDLAADAARRLHDELARWRDKYPYVAVSQEVVHAQPGRLLAGLSARADLVVLGRHDVPGSVLDPFLGPAVHTALNHQHGPIAVVPSSWPGD